MDCQVCEQRKARLLEWTRLFDLCAACGLESKDMYMVANDLWAAFGAGKGVLHVACLEDRMGRRLRHNDFKDERINSAIRAVLR